MATRRAPDQTNTFTEAIENAAECLHHVTRRLSPAYQDLAAAVTMPDPKTASTDWALALGNAWLASVYSFSKLAEQTAENVVLLATGEVSTWATPFRSFKASGAGTSNKTAPIDMSVASCLFEGNQVRPGEQLEGIGMAASVNVLYEDAKSPDELLRANAVGDWTGRFAAIVTREAPYIPGRLALTLSDGVNSEEFILPIHPYRGGLKWDPPME